MFKLKSFFIIILGFIVFGCGSTNTAKLSSNNLDEGIVEVENLRDVLINNQTDLLAYTQFEDGVENFQDAIEKNNKNESKADVIEELSQAKASFLEARALAGSRAIVPVRVLAARKASLDNSIKKNVDSTHRLKKTDDSLRNKTNNFTKSLSVKELSDFEIKYLKLEIDAVQNRELMVYRDIVKNAQGKKALRIASKTFQSAQKDLNAAENMIQQSPRNPENYRQSVLVVANSAKLLRDVMEKLNGVAKGASEQAALDMVYQERKLTLLSDKTNRLEGSLSRTQGDLDQATDELENKTNEALSSAKKVRLQDAISHVRKNFSDEEAEVYQQGDDLIIRLKTIDFKSGSAMVPGRSMDLLSKVNSIIEKLHSSKVLIEGHTDSTGERGSNHILSVKRSEAVARYLGSLGSPYQISSKGYGESRPIANNQTKEGRAVNRRVDIIVSTTTNL